MWIFIWIVLSSILMGATLWSLQILLRQKMAWEKYAKMKNLSFRRGTFMGPAEMDGIIGDYKLAFFTAERAGEDIRTRRYVTVVEIDLMEGLIDGGVIGTKEMVPFMQSLDKLHRYQISKQGWDENHYAFMKFDEVAKAYLTDERLDICANILKTKNADVLMIFNERELLVRLETSDPMQDAEKIDKILTRIMGLCNKLRITPEQRKEFMALATPVTPA